MNELKINLSEFFNLKKNKNIYHIIKLITLLITWRNSQVFKKITFSQLFTSELLY